MINPHRERELAMQLTGFLDGTQEFPFDLTDEECEFVDRLVAVNEMLFADPQLADEAINAVNRVTVAAGMQSDREPGTGSGQSLPNTGGAAGNQVVDATSIRDELTEPIETCDNAADTVEERDQD